MPDAYFDSNQSSLTTVIAVDTGYVFLDTAFNSNLTVATAIDTGFVILPYRPSGITSSNSRFVD